MAITPIGPGLILKSVRSTLYLPSLFSKLISMNIITSNVEGLGLMSKFRSHFSDVYKHGLMKNIISDMSFVLFGFNNPLGKSLIEAQSFESAIIRCFSIPGYLVSYLPTILYNSFMRLYKIESKKNLKTLGKNVKYFILHSLHIRVSRSVY